MQIRSGDVIAVNEKARNQLRVKGASEAAQNRGIAEWLEVDAEKLSGTFKSMPERSDLPADIKEHLVIELYSK
jgi:small subunit ribosomal protein S4